MIAVTALALAPFAANGGFADEHLSKQSGRHRVIGGGRLLMKSSGRYRSHSRPNRDHIASVLTQGLDKALPVQSPTVQAHVARAGARDPQPSPQDLIERLEKQYVVTVTALAGASGATATAPGAGTAIALSLNLLEIGGFLEATTIFVLAVADVHGVHIADLDRRRTLVLAIILGDVGAEAVLKVANRTAPHLANQIVKVIPVSSIWAVNRKLGRNFITKFGTKQGILVLGLELNIGFDALIGAGGNLALGYLSVRTARRVFGAPPTTALTRLHRAAKMEPFTAVKNSARSF